MTAMLGMLTLAEIAHCDYRLPQQGGADGDSPDAITQWVVTIND
jgi:hypothetical protein